MAAADILAIVLVVVVLTGALIRLRPDVVRAYFYNPIEQGRTIGAAVFAAIFIWTQLQGGLGWTFIAAILLIAFAVAYIAYEEPHKDIR